MSELVVAAVVGDRVGDHLGALLAGVVVALEQLHVGVPHRFAVVIGDDAFDGRVRYQAKHQVATVQIGPDGDAGEEAFVLVEALRAVSAGAGGQRVFRRRKAGK